MFNVFYLYNGTLHGFSAPFNGAQASEVVRELRKRGLTAMRVASNLVAKVAA